MIYQSAYFGGDNSGIHVDSDEFLHINNTGYYKDMPDTLWGTNRPNGLPDWQVLYVIKGKMKHSFNDGSVSELTAGDLIIYPPGALQQYHCIGGLTSYVWVHFSGTAATELVNSMGFTPLKIYHSRPNGTAVTYIRAMIEEIRRKKPTYQLKTVSIFIDYMSFLADEVTNESSKSLKYSKLLPALQDIENSPFPYKTNRDYAAMCEIDEYYFIHLFKEVTGLSPLRYATELSMRKAGKLVAETDMDIANIASSMGFPDTCYFSRKFRKFHGLTPSEYRKRQRDADSAFSK